MISSGAPGGRERRKHRRFALRKQVTIFLGETVYEGTLRDISVGGAAIECRAALDGAASYMIEIEDIGAYPANIVRRIDADSIAIRFTITEALAVRMAARIATAYLEKPETAEG